MILEAPKFLKQHFMDEHFMSLRIQRTDTKAESSRAGNISGSRRPSQFGAVGIFRGRSREFFQCSRGSFTVWSISWSPLPAAPRVCIRAVRWQASVAGQLREPRGVQLSVQSGRGPWLAHGAPYTSSQRRISASGREVPFPVLTQNYADS